MPQSNKTVSPLRQRMIEDMTLRKLSEKTQIQCRRATDGSHVDSGLPVVTDR